MNVNDMMSEIATGLRDVICETPEDFLAKEEPNEVYVDLAARLVLRLSKKLTILSNKNVLLARLQSQQDNAATRIFAILTEWVAERPGRSYVTRMTPLGRFEIEMWSPDGTQAYFQGSSIQDAYAQAAQTICLEPREATQ